MLFCSSCYKGHLVKKREYHNVQRLAMQQLDKAFVTWMKRSPFLVRGPWVASVDTRLFQTKLHQKQQPSEQRKHHTSPSEEKVQLLAFPTQINFPIKQHKECKKLDGAIYWIVLSKKGFILWIRTAALQHRRSLYYWWWEHYCINAGPAWQAIHHTQTLWMSNMRQHQTQSGSNSFNML